MVLKQIWRLLCADLTATLAITGHTGPVAGVAFGTSSDHVVTVSAAGEYIQQFDIFFTYILSIGCDLFCLIL